MEYPNFFESQKEAVIRLQGTVVLLDNEPVEVFWLSDHLGDGLIYAYVRPIGLTIRERADRPEPNQVYNFPHSAVKEQGKFLDQWIIDTPSSQMKRVPLSSYGFNKFRPYELGMYWAPPNVYYVERQPNRKTEQGLIASMVVASRLNLEENIKATSSPVDMLGPEMYMCIKGEHPSPKRCIEALTADKYTNTAAAFHRHFAFMRGPVDSLFLAYKSNTIGILPHGDLSQVKLAKNFTYTKEVVDELHLFEDIKY